MTALLGHKGCSAGSSYAQQGAHTSGQSLKAQNHFAPVSPHTAHCLDWNCHLRPRNAKGDGNNWILDSRVFTWVSGWLGNCGGVCLATMDSGKVVGWRKINLPTLCLLSLGLLISPVMMQMVSQKHCEGWNKMKAHSNDQCLTRVCAHKRVHADTASADLLFKIICRHSFIFS